MQTFIFKLKLKRQKQFLSLPISVSIVRLTLHVSGEPVLVGEAVIRPLLPECDLHAVLHLDIVNLGKTSDEQIHHDQGCIICKQSTLLI